MDQEAFNLSIRKFLKTVGVGSQREIEQAVAKAIVSGTISGGKTLRDDAADRRVAARGQIRWRDQASVAARVAAVSGQLPVLHAAQVARLADTLRSGKIVGRRSASGRVRALPARASGDAVRRIAAASEASAGTTPIASFIP